MKNLIVALLFLVTGVSHAQWTTEQRGLAAATALLFVVDYGQTRDLIYRQQHRDCSVGCYQERNPILGPQPSRGRVNTYFVITPILASIALNSISSENRTWALRGLAALEVYSVGKNMHLGLSVRF
jgi:hypothetical protein